MKTVSTKEKYIWNTIGGLCSSFMSIILLLIVNQSMGNEIGGIFGFGYSHSQLMYTIGVFEVRPLQCTDVKEHFKFNTYFSFRLITCAVMFALTIGYIIFGGFTGERAMVIFYLCLYKLTEAFTDLYSAYFQQVDRIDYSGKTIAARALGASVTFSIVLIATHNLIWASASMTIISMILFVVYDFRIFNTMGNVRSKFHLAGMKELIITAFPLFLSTFIMMYINNAPKYAINRYCSDLVQNKYNILFMPAFVINMFSVFVFRPMLTTMTEEWNDGRIKSFVLDIGKVMLAIAILTLICFGGAFLLGIPVLSRMYHTDLSGDKIVLLLVMIYGGLNAVIVFLYYVIAVTRKQKYLIIAYLLGFLVAFLVTPVLVQQFEMVGAVIAAIISIAVPDIILLLILFILIKRRGETKELC